MWETLTQQVDDLNGLIHRQGRLGQPDQLFILQPPGKLFYAFHAIDEVGDLWCVTSGAFYLFVAFVANQKDVVAIAVEAHCFTVNFGHQWTRCIQGQLLAAFCFLAHSGRNAVCGKYEVRTFWCLGGFFDENDSTLSQRLNNVLVVNNLLTHINWCAVFVQCLFNCLNCTIHTGTIAAGCRQENILSCLSHAPRLSQLHLRQQTGCHARQFAQEPGRSHMAQTVNSPEAPWPVGKVNDQVKGWIEKLGFLWVEGQLTQINIKSTWKLSYLTLRDIEQQKSVQLTCP